MSLEPIRDTQRLISRHPARSIHSIHQIPRLMGVLDFSISHDFDNLHNCPERSSFDLIAIRLLANLVEVLPA